ALAALLDLDAVRPRLRLDGQAAAQHVLEVDERVAAARQLRGELGVGEARQLELHGHAALGERALDGVELGRVERAREARAGHLVERRSRSREGRDPAGDLELEAPRALTAS